MSPVVATRSVDPVAACDSCLRRTALLGLLAPRLERAPRTRGALRDVLGLADDDLLAALAGRDGPRLRTAYAAVDPVEERARIAAAGLGAVCRHDPAFPPLLLDDPSGPALLHVRGGAGRLAALATPTAGRDVPPAVAIVGARRATPEALEVARGLGRSLAAAGITVVSGLALGVDSAAHEGALDGGGRTVAVLATGADTTYPRTKHALGERIAADGAIVSELPPGTAPFRWAFPARNRTIAGLAHLTVVVEAAERSGSVITADFATQLGRDVAAVPGPARSARARGANLLLKDGAGIVLDARDVLDALLGAGAVLPPAATSPDANDGVPASVDAWADLPDHLRRVRERVLAGATTAAEIAPIPGALAATLAALADLELRGAVRRTPAGTYVAVAR